MTDSLNVNNDLRRLVRYNQGKISTDSVDDPRSPAGYPDFALSVGFEKAYRAGATLFSKENRARYQAVRGGLNSTIDFKRVDKIDDVYKQLEEAKIKYLKSKNLPKDQLEKAIEGVKQKNISNVQKQLTQTNSLNSKDFASKIDDINKQARQLDLDALKNNMARRANYKPTTRWGKVVDTTKTITGYKKGRQLYDSGKAVVKEAVINSSKLRKVANGVSAFTKSNALTAVTIDTMIVGGMEVFDTYNNLGEEAAKRQAKREVGNGVAKVAGFAAGNKVGAMIGAPVGAFAAAKLGAVCGSWAGPIGAGIGALIGLACGFAGAYLAGLGSEKVLGKSELEQHTEMVAEEAANNADTFKYLTDTTNFMSIQKDSSQIADSYNRVLGAYLRGDICNPKSTTVSTEK